MKKLLFTLLISSAALSSTMASATEAGADKQTIPYEVTGHINHDSFQRGEKGVLILPKLPTSLEAFKTLYDKVAAEPQGAAGMYVVALKLYRDYPDWGEQAVDYARVDGLDGFVLSRMKSKLRKQDNYAQPYIADAYFEGATPSNQYTPNKPYTINLLVAKHYEPLSRLQAKVIPLYVKAYGKDWNNNPNRNHHIAVIKPRNANLYRTLESNDLFMGILPPDLEKK